MNRQNKRFTVAHVAMISFIISACEPTLAVKGENSTRFSSAPSMEKQTTDLENLETCLTSMKRAAEQGNSAASRMEFERALEIWRRSAADGNEYSSFSLCMFHMTETTPEKYRDHKEGFKNCASMALHGYKDAQYILGKIYGGGVGVEKDETKAFYWFKMAAEGGEENSQYIVGLYYLLGRGAPQDYVLAYKWLNLAASNGVEAAIEKRHFAESLMTRSELSEAQEASRSYMPRQIEGRDICSKWLAERKLSY
jgi:TPR repeat protein